MLYSLKFMLSSHIISSAFPNYPSHQQPLEAPIALSIPAVPYDMILVKKVRKTKFKEATTMGFSRSRQKDQAQFYMQQE
jgi:hypothetical protein